MRDFRSTNEDAQHQSNTISHRSLLQPAHEHDTPFAQRWPRALESSSQKLLPSPLIIQPVAPTHSAAQLNPSPPSTSTWLTPAARPHPSCAP
eukprot:365235-Chlamydomonas_euryale.AAC.3